MDQIIVTELNEKLEHYNLVKEVRYADLGDTEEELELAENYRKLICKTYGHVFEIDQCGMEKHDFCWCCGEYTIDLGYKRHPEFAKPTINDNRVWVKK